MLPLQSSVLQYFICLALSSLESSAQSTSVLSSCAGARFQAYHHKQILGLLSLHLLNVNAEAKPCLPQLSTFLHILVKATGCKDSLGVWIKSIITLHVPHGCYTVKDAAPSLCLLPSVLPQGPPLLRRTPGGQGIWYVGRMPQAENGTGCCLPSGQDLWSVLNKANEDLHFHQTEVKRITC